jgi:hypothetical protein
MRVTLDFCDLCEGDYKKAVAAYIDSVGEEHAICKDCLELVKQEGLSYREVCQGEEADDLFEMLKK